MAADRSVTGFRGNVGKFAAETALVLEIGTSGCSPEGELSSLEAILLSFAPSMERAFPGLDVPPLEPPSPKPVINTSWGIRSWCWAQVGSERPVRLVLEGLMQFTGIPGRIIVTGACLDGLEVAGAFDTFAAEPDKEFYRSMSLNVRGPGPAGKVPIKAWSIADFCEIRGSKSA
jgi:hypothetical protein